MECDVSPVSSCRQNHCGDKSPHSKRAHLHPTEVAPEATRTSDCTRCTWVRLSSATRWKSMPPARHNENPLR